MVDPVSPAVPAVARRPPRVPAYRRVQAPEPMFDIPATRAALRSAADACRVLCGTADGAVELRGSDWSVAEVAAHVAVATEVYIGYARGETDPFVDVSDIAGGSLATTSAQRLAEEPERD